MKYHAFFFLNEETTFENIISLQFLKLKYLKGIVCYYLLYSQEWEDDRLTWTPAAKDDIDTIFAKPATVWKPELIVDNS